MIPKVVVVLITEAYVEEEVWDALLLQDYPHVQILCSQMSPRFPSIDETTHKYANCSDHRNQAAKLALASDADYFLFVDSDTAPPVHAISSLMLAGKKAIGGWYPCLNSERWVAGYWSDDLFFNYRNVEPGVAKVGMMGLGCALIHREIVEKIQFRSGLDTSCSIAYSGKGTAGECAAFGLDCKQQGFEIFMHGDVVCRHLRRKDRKPQELITPKWNFLGGKR